MGGQRSLRPYWRNYFEKTDAVVWVVDSSDPVRMEDCREELWNLLAEEVWLVLPRFVYPWMLIPPAAPRWCHAPYPGKQARHTWCASAREHPQGTCMSVISLLCPYASSICASMKFNGTPGVSRAPVPFPVIRSLRESTGLFMTLPRASTTTVQTHSCLAHRSIYPRKPMWRSAI